MDKERITNDGLGDRDGIWAPWRMVYLEALAGEKCACFFCKYRDEPENDPQNLVVWRGKKAYLVLNRFPYTGGHCMVAPYDHIGQLDKLSDETLSEMMLMLRDAQSVISHAVHPHGFNVGMNLGRCAGAGVPDHVHAHIVPRWEGDTNFMPVLGQTHVIPEFLSKTRARFVASAKELGLDAKYGMRD